MNPTERVFQTLESQTPGFTLFYTRGYRNISDHLRVSAGIDNLTDNTYLEHLNLRYAADDAAGIGPTRILAPGFSPFVGVELLY